MTGRELKQLAAEMGLTDAEVCREADISLPTLTKVYADRKVKSVSRTKVLRALERLRNRLMPAVGRVAVG